MSNIFINLKYSFLISFTLVVILYHLSCIQSTEPIYAPGVRKLPAIKVPWDSTKSVVCFGTSLTYGLIWNNAIVAIPKSSVLLSHQNNNFFYHKADSAYPHCLDNKLKLNVYNKGQPGALVDKALQIVQDSVLSVNPALVLLEFGANDFLREKEVDETRDKMDSLITILKNFGSKVILISFVNEYTIDHPPKDHYLYGMKDLATSYFQMLQHLAEVHQILFVKDCFWGVFENEKYMQEEIHPNELGYKQMAENIATSLENTFIKNKMFRN